MKADTSVSLSLCLSLLSKLTHTACFHLSLSLSLSLSLFLFLSHLSLLSLSLPPPLSLRYKDAIICEDDLSIELAALWKRPVPLSPAGRERKRREGTSGRPGATLADVLAELHRWTPDWELCQLSVTCFTASECRSLLPQMANALTDGRLTVIRSQLRNYQLLWGAVAYVVSPKGQARILDALWPGGKNGSPFEDLRSSVVFPMPNNTHSSYIADSLIYRVTRPEATFVASRPLFASRTEHTHLHTAHLKPQERSKYLVEQALYLRDVRHTYPEETFTKEELAALARTTGNAGNAGNTRNISSLAQIVHVDPKQNGRVRGQPTCNNNAQQSLPALRHPAGYIYAVCSLDLYIRSAPSMQSPPRTQTHIQMATVHLGTTEVVVLRDNVSTHSEHESVAPPPLERWLEVEVGGGAFVSVRQSELKLVQWVPGKPRTHRVAYAPVNIRDRPSLTTGKVLGMHKMGVQVEVLQVVNDDEDHTRKWAQMPGKVYMMLTAPQGNTLVPTGGGGG